MPLVFRNVRLHAPDLSVDFAFSEGAIIGVVGPDGSGKRALLRLATGLLHPDAGEIERLAPCYLASPTLDSADPSSIRRSLEAPELAAAALVGVGPSFSLTDLGFQSRLMSRLHARQSQGATILLASHDLGLLERHCDEMVALGDGHVVERGDPAAVLANYRRRVLRAALASSEPAGLNPASRHGDRRAAIRQIEILDDSGRSVSLIQSGQQVCVRLVVRYRERVETPVVGIAIRSRIGVTVYGTNTELEGLRLGPVQVDEEWEVRFRFQADLCAGEYSLTVASHDPDGVAHEWLEEAVRFEIGDTRYTAGVANLRAAAEARRVG